MTGGVGGRKCEGGGASYIERERSCKYVFI